MNDSYKIRNIIFRSLENKELGRAFAQLSMIANQSHQERLLALKQTYQTQLDYQYQGIDDPERDIQFRQLIKQTYELTDDVCMALARQEYSEDSLFEQFWLPLRYREQQIQAVDQLIQQDNSYAAGIAVAAITLNTLRMFGLHKLHCLLKLCRHSNAEVAIRALTGVLLVLTTHAQRLTYYPSINNALNVLFNDDIQIERAQNILMQLVRSKETDRITGEINTHILPQLRKIAPNFTHTPTKQDAIEDVPPQEKIEEMLEESGIADSLAQFGEMQMAGTDVNYTTFSLLKSDSFFKSIDHWLIPFSEQQQSIASLFKNDDEDTQRLRRFLANKSILCDSDKYSFCLQLIEIPSDSKGLLIKQLELPEEVDENNKERLIIRNYVNDLYRFFKLYPEKEHYGQVMEGDLNFFKQSYFHLLDPDGTFEPKLSNQCFDKQCYQAALCGYTSPSGNAQDNLQRYCLMAYCYQQLGNYSTAIQLLDKALQLNPNDLTAIRQAAICHKKCAHWAEAAQYYTQLHQQDKENIQIIFNLVICHTHLAEYTTALNYCYGVIYNNNTQQPSDLFCLYYAHNLWATGNKKEACNQYLRYPFKLLSEALNNAPITLSNSDIVFITDWVRYHQTDSHNGTTPPTNS